MTSDARDAAIQFYRAWLRIAAAASVLGNVAHATLSHPPSWIVAVAVAVGPPVVWLAAVHGLALLVRAEIRGWTYAFAAVGTLLLGGLAAFVSFNALSDLVYRWAGYSGLAAVLVALAVDLSMGISTLALMALTRPGLADAGEEDAELEYSSAEVLHPNAERSGADREAARRAPRPDDNAASQRVRAGGGRDPRGRREPPPSRRRPRHRAQRRPSAPTDGRCMNPIQRPTEEWPKEALAFTPLHTGVLPR